MINRRQFGQIIGVGTGAAAIAAAAPAPNRFYFAVIADTHIIDEFYKGPEGNALDTETIFKTTDRLTAARDFINKLDPPMEKIFLVGDYFHNYPSADWDFYFKNKTRVDRAKEITDGFKVPVHVGFGNHDYDVPRVSREFSHDLFREKYKVKPYYSVDYKGFKFLHLNNFMGDTWNPKSSVFNKGVGSLGEEQLNWAEAELAQRKPTFVFIHFPLMICADVEVKDYGLHPMLRKYRDSIQRVVSGHMHKWYDFAHTFGPLHTVMGATRYDEDAYMLIEVDTAATTHRVLNFPQVEWSTHYSKPYDPKG
jgi:UDP-2,3-diacylglucosamine pyrophosphatase LpxH